MCSCLVPRPRPVSYHTTLPAGCWVCVALGTHFLVLQVFIFRNILLCVKAVFLLLWTAHTVLLVCFLQICLDEAQIVESANTKVCLPPSRTG